MTVRRFNPRRFGKPSDVPELRAYAEDAQDIKQTTDDLADESKALRERVTSLGAVALVAYCHVSLDAGQPSTIAARGMRVQEVGAVVTMALEPALDASYSAVADDQADEPAHYFTRTRRSTSMLVAAYDFAGAVVDLSVSSHEFVVRAFLPIDQKF